MSLIRVIVLVLVLASSTLLAPRNAEAGLCGFPGAVLAGSNIVGGPGANLGYVVLFDVATLQQNGIASVRLSADYGKACMDIWRDAAMGPDPTNFLAVFAQSPANGNPVECAQQGCSVSPGALAFCRLVTLCLAFP